MTYNGEDMDLPPVEFDFTVPMGIEYEQPEVKALIYEETFKDNNVLTAWSHSPSVGQIYVKNEATAIQVKQKLSKGEKFDSLASTYNEAGIIEKNLARGELPEEVDAVAFRLDNDEESDMITTDKGYYFIKCLNKFDSELTEANKANIIVKRRKEQFEDKFVGFIEESKFDLNEEVWANIKIDTSGAIKTDSFFAVYEKYFEE